MADELSLATSGLNLIPLLDDEATARRKAFAASGLASSGAKAAGAASGLTSLADVGQGLGTASSLAGAGYGIYDIATNPNLSTKQKAGHAGETAANTVAGVAFWPYGLALAARALTGLMEKSGSPQVSGAGKAIAAPALPVEAGLDVLRGDLSPRAAANRMVRSIADVPILGGPMGSVMRAFGLGTKPTTGTMFRRELGSVFDKLGLKDPNMGAYNVDLTKFTPEQIRSANQLAARITPFSRTAQSHPENQYQTQTAGILLNSYGANITSRAKAILDDLNKGSIHG